MENYRFSLSTMDKIIEMINSMTLKQFKNMYSEIGLPSESYADEKYTTLKRSFSMWYNELTDHNKYKVYNYVYDKYINV